MFIKCNHLECFTPFVKMEYSRLYFKYRKVIILYSNTMLNLYLAIIYRTGALLCACAYISTGKKYVLIHEIRLLKSTFFNAGILRTAAKYALNSEYAPNNTPVR